MTVPQALVAFALLVVAFAMGRCTSADDSWRAEAEAARQAVADLEDQRTSLQVVVDSLVTARVMSDSVYARDSVRWADEHDEHEARISELAQTAAGMADSIRVHVDSAGAEWFAAYVAAQDSLEARYGAQILALQAQVAALWEQRQTLVALAQNLQTADHINRQIIAAQEAELALLRKQANPGFFAKLERSMTPMLLGVTAGVLATSVVR